MRPSRLAPNPRRPKIAVIALDLLVGLAREAQGRERLVDAARRHYYAQVILASSRRLILKARLKQLYEARRLCLSAALWLLRIHLRPPPRFLDFATQYSISPTTF
jgi:hypothetical protein